MTSVLGSTLKKKSKLGFVMSPCKMVKEQPGKNSGAGFQVISESLIVLVMDISSIFIFFSCASKLTLIKNKGMKNTFFLIIFNLEIFIIYKTLVNNDLKIENPAIIMQDF